MKIATVNTLRLKHGQSRVLTGRQRARYVPKTGAVQLRVEAPAPALDEFAYLRVRDTGAIVPSTETILPMQFWASRPLTKEQRLLLAVLQDAVELAVRPRVGWRPAYERRAAIDWILSPDTSWLFAFESICIELGFDAEAIRAKVMKIGTVA